MQTEAMRIAVVMQRRPLNNRWQPFQWRLLDVLEDVLPQQMPLRRLLDDPDDLRLLFNAFEVRLYRDEAEGYFLNISSPQPCWFVMWRLEDSEEADAQIAVPKTVTLSYNEAARLMDGGEQVESVPASPAITEAMAAFVRDHYKPEPKKKTRKPSFEGGAAVQQMAKTGGAPDERK